MSIIIINVFTTTVACVYADVVFFLASKLLKSIPQVHPQMNLSNNSITFN